MHKTINTQGVVLSRTDFGEADRIIHFLTPDHGKVTGIAKGVRKSKSKLAGGIELFSISDLTFIVGKSEIYTIISARLVNHFDNIAKELERTNVGYESIRLLNKATEDDPEPEYFSLINHVFEALNVLELDPKTTELWLKMQLIRLAGHSPNLKTDCEGNKLAVDSNYKFDFDGMCFDHDKSGQGAFNSNHIKFLRLGFAAAKPQILHKVERSKEISGQIMPLIQTLLQSYIRV
jgi:DNA repair protein RecO (recombination protein O)